MQTPTSVQEQIPETKAEKRSSCHPDKDEIRSREDVRHRGQEGKAREWVPGALEKREIWEMDGPDVSRARLTGGEGGPESVERRWGSGNLWWKPLQVLPQVLGRAGRCQGTISEDGIWMGEVRGDMGTSDPAQLPPMRCGGTAEDHRTSPSLCFYALPPGRVLPPLWRGHHLPRWLQPLTHPRAKPSGNGQPSLPCRAGVPERRAKLPQVKEKSPATQPPSRGPSRGREASTVAVTACPLLPWPEVLPSSWALFPPRRQ